MSTTLLKCQVPPKQLFLGEAYLNKSNKLFIDFNGFIKSIKHIKIEKDIVKRLAEKTFHTTMILDNQ